MVINGLARRQEAGEIVSGLAQEFGVRALDFGADMSKPADVRAMVEEAAHELGAVDILVNNAGIQHVEAIETFPPEKWDAIIGIDLSSAFHAIRAALPAMKSRGWGRIINAGLGACAGWPRRTSRPASPQARHPRSRTVALETAEHGVTVNAICPGYVLTPLVEKQIPRPRARATSRLSRSCATCCCTRSRRAASSPPRRSAGSRCSCARAQPPDHRAALPIGTAAGRQ